MILRTGYTTRRAVTALLLVLCWVPHVAAVAAVNDLANGPLANGMTSATAVKPNIAFVVDDSGSMDDQNMPDDDATNKGARCWGWRGYNTLFYNPAYTYKPPFKLDGALYGDNVTRFTDASFTAALKDGYFPSGGYTFSGGNGTNTTTDLSSRANLTPNPVMCQPGATATLTVTGTSNTYVSNVTVNGVSVFTGGPTNDNTDPNVVASRIAAQIALNGYSATAAGNVVTIYAPASAGNLNATPVVSKSGGMTIAASAFGNYASRDPDCPASPTRYYYSTHKTNANSTTCEADSNYDIVTDPDKIGAPGIPASGRSAAQIAAAKTNYANWYTYYRRRAMMMKASAGEAFKDLDQSKYRVGLFFLNSVESGADNSTQKNNDLQVADFSGTASGTQRYSWFSKMYGSRDGGWTPLRGSLSRMGRMYAGQISGWDPVQYSCQQNFTIMSTDGYWNTPAETSSYGPKKIDGSADVGNQDAAATAAVSARATISISAQSGSGSNSCYRFTGIAVNTGAATVELLNAPAPATCSTNRDSLGQAARDSINAKSGTTGFSATYDSGSAAITVTAPASLGALAATPVLTVVKDSGGKSRSFTAAAFNGGAAASTGATIPYRDVLNVSNTLADVAYYYYMTDLRNASLGNCSNTIGSTVYSNLCKDNVRGNGKDSNSQQHMTTFTIGLGVSGTIKYESNYEDAPNIVGVTQYYDIKNGNADWPNPNTDRTKIDDLWHAAVNGRGTYYSASDAGTLKQGIQSALAGIQARKGSSSAAATSNLEPVAGDNFVYVALYQTLKWDGDLMSFSIDPATGELSATPNWSAQTQLDAQVAAAAAAGTGDGRTIKFFSSGTASKLRDFDLTNLTADNLHGNFANICGNAPAIDQCGSDADDLGADQKTAANSAANLINYLRGSGTHEDEASNATTANRLYRGRDHVLGDIVNAVPVYVKKPPFSYDTFDATYATFKTGNAERAPSVFIAANDGMLHAINADNGNERWAYVPQQVMKNLWRLADRNYANNHQYFVDGSPTVADICASLSNANAQMCASAANWKTILVGGLNKGGCGYYALDVTDPNNPKGLWEFTDDNLGYSYGNPVVAKRKDGRWVVIFASGYNNYPGNGCGSAGDGNGHVFVVDANSGALLEDIVTYTSGTTPAGTASTPSGLSRLNAWIEDDALPIASRLYGGDLLGNVWRIDFDDNFAPSGKEAVLLARLKDSGNNSQPVTTRPELAVARSGGTLYPVVMVGTGKYLGVGDINDTSQQSVYALKDALATTGISNVRGGTMKARTLAETTGSANGALAGRTIRQISGDVINWAANDGWYFDLNPGNASPGERVNVDMQLQLGALTVAANVPADNACDVGGNAFLYFLDFNTGMNVSTATDGMAGVRLGGNALVAGIKTVRLTTGRTVTIVTDTGGNVSVEGNPTPPGGGSGGARRTSWRELPD